MHTIPLSLTLHFSASLASLLPEDYGVEHRLSLNGLSQENIAKEVCGFADHVKDEIVAMLKVRRDW